MRSLPPSIPAPPPAVAPAALAAVATLVAGAIAAGAGALPAQSRAVVPAVATELPGNAALALPLRWSQGVLHVIVDAQLLPANFVGQQITGLRLRRPAFLGEGAYAAVQRTLTVRAGFTTMQPVQITQSRAANQPANLLTVAGPAVFSVGASSPPVPPASLGDEFLVIPFATPLLVGAGNLFLEFESGDGPLRLDDPWVDAVWMRGGVDTGYVVPVGNGGCTTRNEPLELRWTGAGGPQRGGSASFVLQGTAPNALVFAWFGLDPRQHPLGATWLGYGASLQPLDPLLVGCHQWAPIDANWLGFAGEGGTFTVQFALPPGPTRPGDRIGVQAAALDSGRAGLPLSFSSGAMLVLDSAGVRNLCSCVHFPGSSANSPWYPDHGLMPVLALEY